MKKKILATLLVIVMAGSASLAIYAGVIGFGDDGQVTTDADLITPFGPGNEIVNGGGGSVVPTTPPVSVPGKGIVDLPPGLVPSCQCRLGCSSGWGTGECQQGRGCRC